jgi:hypothetical protein
MLFFSGADSSRLLINMLIDKTVIGVETQNGYYTN